MNLEFSHALFESITDGAVLLDKIGRIVDWNTSASALFGYTKKEVLGRSLNLIYQQNYPFHKIIQHSLPQKKIWSEETIFIRKNGIKGSCKTNICLLDAATQNKASALITYHNVSSYKTNQSESKKTIEQITQELHSCREMLYLSNAMLVKHALAHQALEAKLRESELTFLLLAENSIDIISRHSPDGTYLFASPSCNTLLGFHPNELVGKCIFKLIHVDDVNKLKKAFHRRKENSHSLTVTYRIYPKTGEYRWFESNIRVIYHENSKVISEIQCSSRDITDRILDKKARLRGQQLAHVFRLSTMEEMASGMAHEITQPLAAIVNYTQGCVRYLQKGDHDSNQIIEVMNKAVTQAERAGEVLHRLKNFFCKGQLVKTQCKINSTIRETINLIRHDLHLSKTKIDFDLMKDLPLINVDKIQFQQVILNLIRNAIEAMKEIHPRDRKIHIQTKSLEGNKIEIMIGDTGPGFSKDILHKFCKPFFTTKAHGTGMGLAICRSIIEAHGGQFRIHDNQSHPNWIGFTLPIN